MFFSRSFLFSIKLHETSSCQDLKRSDVLTHLNRHSYAMNERFRARPVWVCLEPCPLREITTFVEDSSGSHKPIRRFVHMRAFLNGRIEAK